MNASTVFVIEDDDSVRRAIARLLNVAGVPTTSYSSAEALLSAGSAECDACLVSDLKLPGLSGLELLAELRRRGRTPTLILMTAYDSAGVREEAERSGVRAYLAKPFLGAELLAAVRAVMEPPRHPEKRAITK
jgi:two-component system response regulator FixJ